jgi:hypothetical protein
MATRQYDAVLLMEGANDLLNEDSVQMLAAANAMQFMVRDAKSRGLKVLLATLPPQDPSGFRGREGAALVAPYNNALATVAANESIPLVDVYQAFGANFSGLIDSDGLHPTPAGYQKIADTFFAAIKQNLEAGPSVTSSSILAGPHPRSHPLYLFSRGPTPARIKRVSTPSLNHHTSLLLGLERSSRPRVPFGQCMIRPHGVRAFYDE